MITFLACMALLAISYFTYGKYVEKVFGADPSRPTPCHTHADGIDYVPMPAWKAFLIQLLNIAGLGPIFGAILGAMYGPVAFLWITFGGIFMGAAHDYFSGMISLEFKGLSLPEIIGRYLGTGAKQAMRIFTGLMMALVGAVFMLGPAGLLGSLTGMTDITLGGVTIPNFWIWIILAYYFIATLLPIDAIIGRIYPLFGAALVFMAVGILGALLTGGYAIPELSFANMKDGAAGFPIFPTLFITIACGAISGFHATQSPMMARCMKNERQGRGVFFGAMVAESMIAIIWAGIAMSFFGGVRELNGQMAMHEGNAAWAVNAISYATLGKIGGILAILGVIAAPITTGDTAFRSARLIVADMAGIEQRNLAKRLYICIPLFAAGYVITLLPFEVVWRYFAWANQTLAAVSLWAFAVYLHRRRANVFIMLIPALFMTFITTGYLLTSPEMAGFPYAAGMLAAAGITMAALAAFIAGARKARGGIVA